MKTQPNRFYTSLSMKIATLEWNQKDILKQLKAIDKRLYELEENISCIQKAIIKIIRRRS